MNTEKRQEIIHQVLVLNKAYVPVNVISYHSVFSLLFNDKCKAMDRDYATYDYKRWVEFSQAHLHDYNSIGTIKYRIVIPEIIVLTTYDRLNIKDVKYSRQNVFARDNYTCGYCGYVFPVDKLNIDHIHPREKGGKTTWNNVISSCYPCNQKKANMTLEQAGLKLKFLPKQPKWISPVHSKGRSGKMCKSWETFMHRVEV